jgi:hypothetical protein
VRGDSSTERFRDVYRRCLAVFFETARATNPGARLVLFLNQQWDSSASTVACEVAERLEAIGVEHQILEYSHAPPASFPDRWRNQFYVLDVLEALASQAAESDLALVLDSDVVWTDEKRAESLWADLDRHGALTYSIDYELEYPINGLSRQDMTSLARSLGVVEPSTTVAYSGGELVALRGDVLQRCVRRSREIWPKILAEHRATGLGLEEAHLLSAIYAAEDLPIGLANQYIKRLWTQPFKFRNVALDDLELALWHVPAEKKYGLARMYAELASNRQADRSALSRAATLGIPKNSSEKVLRDVSTAMLARVAESWNHRMGKGEEG